MLRLVFWLVQDLPCEPLWADENDDAGSILAFSKEAAEQRCQLGGCEVKADGGHEVQVALGRC